MTACLRGTSLLVLLGLTAAGCSDSKKDTESKVTVHGRILENGQPFSMDKYKPKLAPGTSAPPVVAGTGAPVQMAFIPEAGGDVTYAKVSEFFTFEATNLKAGKYKIALTMTNLPPGVTDPFGGKFAPDKTKIVRDLKDGDEINIDVTKPQG